MGKEKLPGSFLFRAFRRHIQAGFSRTALGAYLFIGLLQILFWNNALGAWMRKPLLSIIALEGETTKLRRVPPPTPQQLDRDKLELENDSWTYKIQLAEAIAEMQQAVRSLVAKLGGQDRPPTTRTTTQTTTTTTTTIPTTITTTQPTTTTTMSPTTTTTTTKAVESLA